MNTRLIINTTLAIAWVGLFASCAPSASNAPSELLASSSSSSQIIGGSNSTADYQKQNGIVGLLTVVENEKQQQMAMICTGSLVSSNVVLTAAHCLSLPAKTKLVAALIFFETDLEQVIAQIKQKNFAGVRSIDNLIRHEDYHGEKNDIGLVHFSGTLPDGFKSSKRLSAQTEKSLQKGSLLTLSGFGVSKYEQDAQTGKMVGEGDGILRQVSDISVTEMDSTGQEMTLDQTKGRGACHGDSGGPAYLVDPTTGENLLVGVTSRSAGEADTCSASSIYTSVMAYEKWINDAILKLNSEKPTVATNESTVQQ